MPEHEFEHYRDLLTKLSATQRDTIAVEIKKRIG